MAYAPFRLDGKIAVVTGAARGIGRAVAIALARAGADIAGIDIVGEVSSINDFAPATEAELAETGTAVGALGRRWTGIHLDQRDLPALRRAAETVGREMGGTDILFANAGIQAFKPLLDMEDADWHDQIDVNLTGTANALRAFAPAIVKREHGHPGVLTLVDLAGPDPGRDRHDCSDGEHTDNNRGLAQSGESHRPELLEKHRSQRRRRRQGCGLAHNGSLTLSRVVTAWFRVRGATLRTTAPQSVKQALIRPSSPQTVHSISRPEPVRRSTAPGTVAGPTQPSGPSAR